MRKLATYPALAEITLPRAAQILDVHDRGAEQAPSLIVSVDEADDEVEARRFGVFPIGATVPAGARFLASFRRHPADGGTCCLFELGEEIPADIPAEAHCHYRTLVRDDRQWVAPDDVLPTQLSTEQLIAVTSLQEYGYGSIVDDA